ncbi:MAG: hypothetical protein EOM50_12050 [Erysipelotrichia bacterium]|nr:hypothetical protein [Erysipelotrichia bacterium]
MSRFRYAFFVDTSYLLTIIINKILLLRRRKGRTAHRSGRGRTGSTPRPTAAEKAARRTAAAAGARAALHA